MIVHRIFGKYVNVFLVKKCLHAALVIHLFYAYSEMYVTFSLHTYMCTY